MFKLIARNCLKFCTILSSILKRYIITLMIQQNYF